MLKVPKTDHARSSTNTSVNETAMYTPDIASEIRGFLLNPECLKMSAASHGCRLYAPSRLVVSFKAADEAARLIHRRKDQLQSLTLAGKTPLYKVLGEPTVRQDFSHLRELTLTKRSKWAPVTEKALDPFAEVLTMHAMPNLVKLDVYFHKKQGKVIYIVRIGGSRMPSRY